jgi:hypothetical protein
MDKVSFPSIQQRIRYIENVEQWITDIQNATIASDLKKVKALKKKVAKLTVVGPHRLLLCRSLYHRGWQAFESGHLRVAEQLFYWLEQLDRTNWHAHLAGATLRQLSLGQTEASRQFRIFVKANPVFRCQESQSQDVVKLGIFATTGKHDINFVSGGYNIPEGLTETQHLTLSPDYSVSTLFIDGISGKDIKPFDCLINAISDSDLYSDRLRQLRDLLNSSNLPIINDPAHSILTTRDYICANRGQSDGLIIPKTVKVKLSAKNNGILPHEINTNDLRYPLLLRPAGTQNGQDFILLNNHGDASGYDANDGDYYLTEYYDFKSRDGFYRKYRCWSIGDEVIPNHLHISDQWNVHSPCRLEIMMHNPWMLEEERAFLNSDNERIADGVRKIKEIIKLDYFGVDFGLTEGGDMILFEANATMQSSFRPDSIKLFPHLGDAIIRHRQSFRRLIAQKISSAQT